MIPHNRYKFAAPGQMGLHWYHAHVRGYLDDGVVGLIYIRPDADRAHPFHLISSDVSDVAAMRKAERHPRYMPFYDWRHVQEDEALSMFDSSGRPTACVDTVLFNGACSDSSLLFSWQFPSLKRRFIRQREGLLSQC